VKEQATRRRKEDGGGRQQGEGAGHPSWRRRRRPGTIHRHRPRAIRCHRPHSPPLPSFHQSGHGDGLLLEPRVPSSASFPSFFSSCCLGSMATASSRWGSSRCGGRSTRGAVVAASSCEGAPHGCEATEARAARECQEASGGGEAASRRPRRRTPRGWRRGRR